MIKFLDLKNTSTLVPRDRSLTGLLTGVATCLVLLAGCIADGNEPDDEGSPQPCTESALCRLQNPADTILLNATQKAQLVSRINSLDTAVVLALTTITHQSLGHDTVLFSLLADLRVTTDSSRLVTSPARPPDTGTILDWRGYAKAPHSGFVDVTFHGDEFESGFAHLNGKYITLYAAGGTNVLVADDSHVVWMGECPPAKRTGTTLTCVPVND